MSERQQYAATIIGVVSFFVVAFYFGEYLADPQTKRSFVLSFIALGFIALLSALLGTLSVGIMWIYNAIIKRMEKTE